MHVDPFLGFKPHRAGCAFFFFFQILFLAGCVQKPIKIGMICGLSGSNADLGEAGRNGAMLAAEMINSNPDPKAPKIDLFIRDDKNDPAQAIVAANELIDEKVEVIVGPLSTSMVEAVLTVTEPRNLLVLTPTASALQFVGKDDYLFKMNSSTRDNTEDYADFMLSKRNHRKAALLIDQQNKSFAESWASEFARAFVASGGAIAGEVRFDGRETQAHSKAAEELLKFKPDVLILIAHSVDVARFSQQVRKIDPGIPLIAAEWAGTQQLIELGGKAVQGLEVLQTYDKFDASPAYAAFLEAYVSRFGSEPSYSSIMSFEAMTIAYQALANKAGKEDLRGSIARNSPYQGLQQEIRFDRYGDSRRKAFFVTVDGNDYIPAP